MSDNGGNNGKRSGSNIRSRFLTPGKNDGVVLEPAESRRKHGGRAVVSMYSDFFSRVTGNMMVTANMYELLNTEIQSVIYSYSVKENILLRVYENSPSATELNMEGILVGFHRFLAANRKKAEHDLKVRFFGAFLAFVIGILMEYLLYGVSGLILPEWIRASLDIIAWVLVWQFAAYVAFDMVSEIRKIRRLAQIERIEYEFRHWE